MSLIKQILSYTLGNFKLFRKKINIKTNNPIMDGCNCVIITILIMKYCQIHSIENVSNYIHNMSISDIEKCIINEYSKKLIHFNKSQCN